MLLPIVLGAAASAATLVGGLLAFRLNERLILVLGLVAGMVLGIALFDLIPEALTLAGRAAPRLLLAWVAGGLGLYMLLERVLASTARSRRPWRTQLGPAALTIHSLMDGLSIGLAFQINREAGWLVAIAVLAHDIADGVNAVSMCLAGEIRSAAPWWLALNAAAPLMGVLLGLSIHVTPAMLAPLLAIFAGIFLYIGACELIPRSYARDPRLRTTLATLGGMALMFAVTQFAG